MATPGRLIDMVNSYNLDLSEVDFFVLDEGDRMLDMGFQDDIVEIQNNLSSEELRSMIFSATVPNFIQKIARDSMESPIMIDLVGDDQAQLPSTLRNMITLAGNQEARMSHIHNFVQANPDLKTLIFTQTKHEARSFSMQKFSKFCPIHGDLSQSEREYALTKFK